MNEYLNAKTDHLLVDPDVTSDKFVNDLLAQKEFTSAAVEHGWKYEPAALKEYEKYVRKIGKPVKVVKSGLFVSPKIPILGCSQMQKWLT